METLLDVMLDARRLAEDDDALCAEVDAHIAELRAGRGDARAMEVLFLPTAHDDALLSLADRFDVAACAHRGHAVHCCRVCGRPAGTLVVEGNELRRESFTSILTQRVTPAVRAALGDAAALFALDPELAPFFCPECETTYCGEHWRPYDVFADGLHDSIRGACPLGHDRMLED